MYISNFTYLAGIASLLGFILQIFNVFPKRAKLRQNIFLIILGIFVGTLLNTLNASHIKFDITFSGYTLLVTVALLVIISFLIAGAIEKDSNKREQFFAISGIALFPFIVILFFGYLFTYTEPPSIENKKITVSERIELAEIAEQKNNFDRAIMHLKKIRDKISKDDARREKIEKKINEMKLKQVK